MDRTACLAMEIMW